MSKKSKGLGSGKKLKDRRKKFRWNKKNCTREYIDYPRYRPSTCNWRDYRNFRWQCLQYNGYDLDRIRYFQPSIHPKNK